MNFKFFIPILASLFIGGSISAEVVNNATIIKMLQKGYSTPVITNYIEEAEDVELTSNLEALDALMEAGADSNLIAYVQEKVKKMNSLEPGLYWYNTDKPVKLTIDPLDLRANGIKGKINSLVESASNAIRFKKGSKDAEEWLSADVLTDPGFKSDNLVLGGEHSDVVINTTDPVFRLYKLGPNGSYIDLDNSWYNKWLAGVQTPTEFQVIKLTPKGSGEKAVRQFPSNLSWTNTGFSTKKDKSKKNLIDFKVRKVKDNIYEITFDKPLEPGEYVFFYKDATQANIKNHLSAFDFTIE